MKCVKEVRFTNKTQVPGYLRLVERWIVSQPEKRFTNHCENVVVVVMTNVKRQIPIDAFEDTRPVQATSSARTYAMFHRFLGEVFHNVPGAAAGYLRFKIFAGFPQSGDMS